MNFAVSFKAAAAGRDAAQVYQSQLLASDALQGVQEPENLGHWVVLLNMPRHRLRPNRGKSP